MAPGLAGGLAGTAGAADGAGELAWAAAGAVVLQLARIPNRASVAERRGRMAQVCPLAGARVDWRAGGMGMCLTREAWGAGTGDQAVLHP